MIHLDGEEQREDDSTGSDPLLLPPSPFEALCIVLAVIVLFIAGCGLAKVGWMEMGGRVEEIGE